MFIIHYYSYIFWNIYVDISCSALDLYLVPWKYISYSYRDIIYSSVKFEHFPLKGAQIDGMQSEKIFYIKKIYYFIGRYSEIDIAWVVLEYVPIVIFIEF